ALLAVYTRRNALLPVHILPPEILARIFQFLTIMDQPGDITRVKTKRLVSLGWIASVTHVYRHWRQVALDTPRLWGRVSLRLGSRWSDEMIARSKSAPLTI
ncbi:hypothetical protein BV25DRAFT_1788805, partial [Artomyces pyxidatus]